MPSLPYITYQQAVQELMPVIIGEQPSGDVYKFRRYLKEAQNMLMNESTIAPMGCKETKFVNVKKGSIIHLDFGYDSILEARTLAGVKYIIMAEANFMPVYGTTPGQAVLGNQPVLLDLGWDNAIGQRKYLVMSGTPSEEENDAFDQVSLVAKTSIGVLTGNIEDENYWSSPSLPIVPNCYPALKNMLMSVAYGEKGNTSQQIDYYNLAVKFLNDYMRRDRQGTLQVPNLIFNGGIGQKPVSPVM